MDNSIALDLMLSQLRGSTAENFNTTILNSEDVNHAAE